LTLIDQVYVHKRLKTALYGFDAVALLHGLRSRAGGMTDIEFHRAMRGIVAQIRDRHTRYSYSGFGPDYRLPFRVERAFDGDKPVYLVTASIAPAINIGSTVLRWNDTPIEAVIRELAEDVGAGNEASRFAMASILLTQRVAFRLNPPDESEVRLNLLRPDGEEFEVRVGWSVSQPKETRLLGPPKFLGLDIDLLTSRRWILESLYPQKLKELRAQPYPNVEARTVRHGETDFGYLRINDFNVEDADDFAIHVAGLLRNLPAAGIVVDLRGNPGGYITAGEMLLQLFTSQRIQPLGFRFRASEAIKYSSDRDTDSWTPTVDQGVRFGADYSAIFPIEYDDDAFNKIGRVYAGPSILIVDALTYSTADMFTAGFKDHAIGPVICTDQNIGAGGANNWPYWVLRRNFPGFIMPIAAEIELNEGTPGLTIRETFASNGQQLPEEAKVTRLDTDWSLRWEIASADRRYLIRKRDWLPDLAVYFDGDNPFVGDLPDGVDFGLSVRQAIRRRSNGLVLEDEGIEADHYYHMTRNDLLLGNVDLIAFACKLLGPSTTAWVGDTKDVVPESGGGQSTASANSSTIL
jgi:hypothetical protein